jgi:hypothetical protein
MATKVSIKAAKPVNRSTIEVIALFVLLFVDLTFKYIRSELF